MAGKQQPGNGLWADWILGESGYKDQMDSNLRFLSAAVQLVLDQSTGALPASPTNGMLVATTGSTDIQARIDGAWVTVATAKKGWLGFDKARDSKVEFDGTEWVLLTTGGGGGGGLPEAPVDGKLYGRQDGDWTLVETTQAVVPVTASRTLGLPDAGAYLLVDSLADLTITVPAESGVDFPVGTDIALEQHGAGAITLGVESGVTINVAAGFELKTGGQYAVASLKKVAADTWTLFGNLEATP